MKIKSQKSQIISRKKALSAIRVLSVEEINLKYIQNSAYISNKSLSHIPRKQRNSQNDPKISPIKVKNIDKILSTKNSSFQHFISFHHSNSKFTNKKSLPGHPLKKLEIQPCVVNIQNCITTVHFPVKKCSIKLKRCDNLFRKLALIPSTLKIQIRKKNQNDKALKKLFDKYYIDDNERDEADVEMTKERFLANFGLGPCKPPPASTLTQNATQETVQDDLPLPIKEITQNANLTQRLCENKNATDDNANDENDCIEYIGEIQFQDNAILEEVDSKEITIAEVWSESLNEEPANKVETKSTSHEESQIPESTKENNSILNNTDKILTEIPTNQEKSLSNIPNQTIKSTQLVKYSCKICHTLFDFESKLKIHEIFHGRQKSQSKKNISTEKRRVNKKRKSVKSASSTDRQQCKQLFSCPFNGCKIVLNRKGLKAIGDKHMLRVHATTPSNKYKWIRTNRDNVCQ